jgi:hypothetical protein
MGNGKGKQMADLTKGSKAEWQWGKGHGEGEIVDKFTSDVTRTIKGTKVVRHATTDDPTYLLKQKDGGRVLKSRSELKGAK